MNYVLARISTQDFAQAFLDRRRILRVDEPRPLGDVVERFHIDAQPMMREHHVRNRLSLHLTDTTTWHAPGLHQIDWRMQTSMPHLVREARHGAEVVEMVGNHDPLRVVVGKAFRRIASRPHNDSESTFRGFS